MRRLRELPDPPRILLLTAAGELAERVYELEELGADDYLTKPFDFVELVARVQVLLGRAPHSLNRRRPGHRQPAADEAGRPGTIAADTDRGYRLTP